MNLVELDHVLRKLRLSGMAAVLETRLRHAQTEKLTPIDLVSTLVSDELLRRQDRLLERRHKQARFRDPATAHSILSGAAPRVAGGASHNGRFCMTRGLSSGLLSRSRL